MADSYRLGTLAAQNGHFYRLVRRLLLLAVVAVKIRSRVRRLLAESAATVEAAVLPYSMITSAVHGHVLRFTPTQVVYCGSFNTIKT